MKFAKYFILVVAVMVFSAGFVLAADGDIGIGIDNSSKGVGIGTGGAAAANVGNITNDNINKLTGINSNANTNSNALTGVNSNVNTLAGGAGGQGGVGGKSNSDAAAKSAANSVNIIRQPLPTVGFTPLPIPGTAPTSNGWELYCPAIYKTMPVEKLEKMQTGVKASIIFPWNWGYTIQASIFGEVSQNDNPVSCTCYWPKDTVVTGDEVLAAGFHPGEAEQTEESFFADVEMFCKEKTGSSRVAILKRDTNEGITTGKSLGLSGIGSGINDAGTSGVAFVGGGMLGKNRTSIEERSKFKFLCLNDGPTMCEPAPQPVVVVEKPVPAPAPAPPKVVESPKPVVPEKAACNPEPIRREIKRLEFEISKCKFWGINNERLRFLLANALVDLAKCTGENGYYSDAINNYKLAEENYSEGYELTATQKFGDRPKGVKTSKLLDARELLYKVYWNWAAVIRELEGRDAEVRFAQSKKLTTMPSGIVELKR